MKRSALAVVVLVVLLLVADRAGAVYGARSIADEVRATMELDAQPDVDITGFPFLTQALSGRYERIEVHTTDVPAGDFVLSRLDATLHGVRAPLSDVLSRDLDAVPVDSVTARALIAYTELSQSYEGQELVVEPEGDRLLLTGQLQVSDQTLRGEALASVEVVDEELAVTAEEVAFGEDGTKQELTEAVREQLDLQVPVPDLPYDLTLTAAEVRPDGMALRAEATDVVLTAD
jgi:hypothetical protein